MKNWVVNNLWMKLAALILAVITWFYVNGELNKIKRASGDFYKSSYTGHTKDQSIPEKRK